VSSWKEFGELEHSRQLVATVFELAPLEVTIDTWRKPPIEGKPSRADDPLEGFGPRFLATRFVGGEG
jgi:hypothetical protein